jgi:hypothetical protein
MVPQSAIQRLRLSRSVSGSREDTAFVFFRTWGPPVDSRLHATAAAFGGGYECERGTPLA